MDNETAEPLEKLVDEYGPAELLAVIANRVRFISSVLPSSTSAATFRAHQYAADRIDDCVKAVHAHIPEWPK